MLTTLTYLDLYTIYDIENDKRQIVRKGPTLDINKDQDKIKELKENLKKQRIIQSFLEIDKEKYEEILQDITKVLKNFKTT